MESGKVSLPNRHFAAAALNDAADKRRQSGEERSESQISKCCKRELLIVQLDPLLDLF